MSVPPPMTSSSALPPGVPSVLPDVPPVAALIPGLIPPIARGRSNRRIGEMVVELGLATEEAVERAIDLARETGRMTGKVLIEQGILTPQQLARVLAERFGIERADLSEFRVNLDLARLVDSSFVRRYD